MSLLAHIGANELGALAAILAIILADDLDADELNTLGNFTVALGSIMLVIAAQKQFLKAQQEKDSTKAQQEKDSTERKQFNN
ncbi:hypothetical protein [Sporomusa sp.]|uniref:hypothetical protein n=1 Tax=Sporomusa sp. TaxID=2078658 RepID=UPI002B6506B9|nr:hypothetical protein [Sporomusa sp.]HWR45652.1 hypothetical protein [Sporomusa sp.]